MKVCTSVLECHVGEGKKCGVVEEVKRQMLKWFVHMDDKISRGKWAIRKVVSPRLSRQFYYSIHFDACS